MRVFCYCAFEDWESLAFECCVHEERVIFGCGGCIHGVRGGTTIYDDELSRSVAGRHFDGSFLLLSIADCDVCSSLNEEGDHTQFPAFRCVMERSFPVFVQRIHVGTEVEKCSSHIDLSTAYVPHSVVKSAQTGIIT